MNLEKIKFKKNIEKYHEKRKGYIKYSDELIKREKSKFNFIAEELTIIFSLCFNKYFILLYLKETNSLHKFELKEGCAYEDGGYMYCKRGNTLNAITMGDFKSEKDVSYALKKLKYGYVYDRIKEKLKENKEIECCCKCCKNFCKK